MEKGLLYYFNGNLQMGMEATRHMIKICDDERLRRSMLEDLHAYEKFENALIRIKGKQFIKPISPMAEMGSQWAMDMKVMMNDSAENMAAMLAKGYEKAIKDMRTNMDRFPDSPEDEMELAKGYMNFMKLTHTKYKGY